MNNKNSFDLITPFIYELKLLKIANLFIYEVGKLMYQHSKQSLPASLLYSQTLPLSTIAKLDLNPGINYIHPNFQRLHVKGLSSFKVLIFGIPSLRDSKIILSVSFKIQ